MARVRVAGFSLSLDGFGAGPAQSLEDPLGKGGTALHGWLAARGVTAVDVAGIATDHCVRATALDAARAGFTTTVLLDLCAGVAPETTDRALAEMAAAGVTLTPGA